MIPGDLLSAFPHRQFHTLPGLLDSWAALPNSYPNACMPMQGGSLYHFYDGLWYDPAERRTHDLPCERRTRYRLSQPDTVLHTYIHTYIHTCIHTANGESDLRGTAIAYVMYSTQAGIRLNRGHYIKGSHPFQNTLIEIMNTTKVHSRT